MKNSNNVNRQLFYALKVAEKSNVPLLIMSNPGAGKTTTIHMYAKVNGYDVVPLVGSNETAEAIHGYETIGSAASIVPGEVVVSSRTRPSWMNRILSNYKNGIKTILFLDEITASHEFVQSALLKLVFDRTVGVEKLPPVEYCLVVSAGNYINNLSSTMNMIAPLMNRFMIYNISIVGAVDIPVFLNKYSGAITNGGKCTDPLERVQKMFTELNEKELKFSEETINIIGEYFERGIVETSNMLEKTGRVDYSITDLRNIYGDVDDDDPNLYGFITPRTLGYLRDVTIACYLCFGKEGIQSDNFKKMINGLCGVGLSKEKRTNGISVKVNHIGSDFYTSISQISVELDKLSSPVLPEYVNYFTDLLKNKAEKGGKFTIPEMQALSNKLNSMCKDNALKNMDRPLEQDILKKLGSLLVNTTDCIPKGTKFSLPTDLSSGKPLSPEEIKKQLEKNNFTVEKLSEYVNVWNKVANTYITLNDFVQFPNWNYSDSTKANFKELGETLSVSGVSVKLMHRVILMANPGSTSLIPEVVSI